MLSQKFVSPVKIMPSLLKIFSFSDMYGGATKQCWQLHLLHSTNLIKIYHQKTAWAISGLWQTWNMACQPQIRLEMLVSEKVITATRIKCMYNFTFRQLWFLAESRRWRNLCLHPDPDICVLQVRHTARPQQGPEVAHILGEALSKCKPHGSRGAPKSSTESLVLCSRDQKDWGALFFWTWRKIAKCHNRNNKCISFLPPENLLQEVLPPFLVLRGKMWNKNKTTQNDSTKQYTGSVLIFG